MLTITVLGNEYFDDEKEEFVTVGDLVLELEHSLVALSKWEQVFEKPFLGKTEKTTEETLGYLYAMIITPNVPSDIVYRLSDENVSEINAYIDRKMTATWFSDVQPAAKNQETITNELIYYWMNSLSIPIECENWHLNRLFTLIRVHSLKNAKPKPMSDKEIGERNRMLNAQRRAKLKSNG